MTYLVNKDIADNEGLGFYDPRDLGQLPNPATEEDAQNGNDIFGPVAVCTPEIVRMAQTVADWIRNDLPGGAVYGKQRNGKSWGCFYLSTMIGNLVGQSLAAVYWSAETDTSKPQPRREFFQERMLQAGCLAVGSRDLAVLRKRLYDHLDGIARRAGSTRLLLIVDEAHLLDFSHFLCLIQVHNALERRRIRPFFLLVGQPELEDLTEAWMEGNGQHVIGRFFVREHWFRGIAQHEIVQVLEAFDQPEDENGQPAAQRLLPDAWERGFRIASLAPAYVEAVDMICAKHGIGVELRLPMQYLRTSLIVLLRRTAKNRLDPILLTSAHVLASLRESGFIKVLMFYAVAEPDDDLDQVWQAHV